MDLFMVPILPIITVLLINSNSIDASPAMPHNNRAIDSIQPSLKDSPYWEYILREFVFKTISSPPQFNNVLYKKLLEAPFYSGPLPAAQSNEDNALLSRGDVYHLPDGRWILCQEGCENCTPCNHQNDSLVKWTLKRIKHFIDSDLYRYDLQLTVEPQRGITFGNFGPTSTSYLTDQLNSSRRVLITTQKTHIDRSRSRSWRRMQRDQNGQLDRHEANAQTEGALPVNPSVHQLSLLNTFQINGDNNNNNNNYYNLTNKFDDNEPTHQLIMGFDKLGNKHIIHMLSSAANTPERSLIHYDDNVNYQLVNDAVKFNRIYLNNQRLSAYQSYIRKLLDDIYAHRPIVETFLNENKFHNGKVWRSRAQWRVGNAG